MKESDARRLWLIRAFEAPFTSPWSEGDAVWATDEARRQVGGQASLQDWACRRAQLAADRLAGRSVALRDAMAHTLESPARGTGWIVGAGVLAFTVGLTMDTLSHKGRVDLLSLPLIGLLAWNLLVYASLLMWPVARRRAAGAGSGWLLRSVATSALQRVAQTLHDLERARTAWGSQLPAESPGWTSALLRFATSWAVLARPIWQARATAALHLAAAGLAAGAIAGLYLRGLGLEYQASWDSTFLSAPQALQAVQVLLGPASAISGLSLPSPEAFEALRGSAGGGENAARWIHLWAVTLGGAVVGPRLVLAAVSLRRAGRASRGLSLPWAGDDWLRQLASQHRTGVVQLRVLPYRIEPSETTRARLRSVLTRSLGSEPAIAWHPSVTEGQDGAALAGSGGQATVVLASARQTPERETHGRLLRELQSAASGRVSGPLLLLVDTAGFGERLSRADAAGRLSERRSAWEDLARELDLEAVFVDLASDASVAPRDATPHDAIARRLMAADLPDR